MSIPPKVTLPPVTSQNPAMSFVIVDFPPPDGPIIETTSHFSISRLIFLSIISPSKYCLDKLLTSIN